MLPVVRIIASRWNCATRGRISSIRAPFNLQRLQVRCVTTSVTKTQGVDNKVKVHERDLRQRSSEIRDVILEDADKMLKITLANDTAKIYPYIWLRDNCQCPKCFHKGSSSRIHLIEELDLNAVPVRAQVCQESDTLEIEWTDGHVSNYELSWLVPRAFRLAEDYTWTPSYRLPTQPWGSELMESLPRASFPEMMSDDLSLLKWLQHLEIFGFVLVSDAPSEPGQVRRLAEKVAFIKKTHYGEDFTVKVKNEPSNVAYLSGPLQLHADLPYYQYKPGVQFIHCITQYQGNGGDSLVVDGLNAAQILRDTYPRKYEILTNTNVDWFDEGVDEVGEFYKMLQIPMICTDRNGDVRRINFSQPQRDSFFRIPAEDVADWYDAMKTFHSILSDPKNCLRFKMVPGNILTFDNLRILHGRTAYLSGHGERHVEGCYVDWDEVRSRRRVLERKL